MIEPIINFILEKHELLLGAVLGCIVTKLFDYSGASIKHFLKTRKANKGIGDITLDNNEYYVALDHGIPFYEHKNIETRKTTSKLIVEIPQKYHELLNIGKNEFVIREGTLDQWHTVLKNSFEYFGLDNYKEEIRQAAIASAEEFVDDINQGHTRFNSELFGVEKIRPNRTGEEEESSLLLDFYSTDYFTYRVFGKIYQKIREKKGTPTSMKVQTLNRFYTPFLSSFGIGCFIIIDRGKGDEVLLAHRSNAVMVDKGKVHYSMNEAFSLNDIEDVDKFPSLSTCLFRGLREELGINSNFKENVIQNGFLDLGMITDRCEVGISAFARMDWTEGFKVKHLGQLYSIGQDSELETDKLELIPIKKLESHLEENYDKFSIGCRNTLKLLLARYEAGYLKK